MKMPIGTRVPTLDNRYAVSGFFGRRSVSGAGAGMSDGDVGGVSAGCADATVDDMSESTRAKLTMRMPSEIAARVPGDRACRALPPSTNSSRRFDKVRADEVSSFHRDGTSRRAAARHLEKPATRDVTALDDALWLEARACVSGYSKPRVRFGLHGGL